MARGGSRESALILRRTAEVRAFYNSIEWDAGAKIMTENAEAEMRRVVRDELLGIITDCKSLIGTKDPTGFAKKALDGLAFVITRRQGLSQTEQDDSQPGEQ
ncbi:MAG TPA: hypothetical protein VGB17_00545 [Pyrinomonadaceae bacterium]|jgi:hypothetical protein